MIDRRYPAGMPMNGTEQPAEDESDGIFCVLEACTIVCGLDGEITAKRFATYCDFHTEEYPTRKGGDE